MQSLYTWIDLNGVYYPQYESAYPDHPAGRSPLSSVELERLGTITGIDFATLNGFQRKLGPQISFERPELSPCLSKLKSKKSYDEALEIIRMGQKRLRETPRADMNGFVPCEQHLVQLKKYEALSELAAKNRKALREGEKHYEHAGLSDPQ
jgi:hypothetical protein